MSCRGWIVAGGVLIASACGEVQEAQDVDAGAQDVDAGEDGSPALVQDVTAEPTTVVPAGAISLEVTVDAPDSDNLTYSWSAPDGWELNEEDAPETELTAPDDYGASATIEVVVTNEAGESDQGDVTVGTDDPFCGGDGSEDEPWEICSATTLNRVGIHEDYLADHFELTQSIDMNDIDAESFHSIGSADAPFAGTFDGDDHTIYNLSIDSEEDEIGLFGVIGTEGRVENIVLTDVTVTGTESVGPLAAVNGGTVDNCHVDVDDDPSSAASVEATVVAGGLVGRAVDGSSIANSSSNAFIDVVSERPAIAAGGLVGMVSAEDEAAVVKRAYALGHARAYTNVVYDDPGNADVQVSAATGGLVGKLEGELARVEDSYAVGLAYAIVDAFPAPESDDEYVLPAAGGLVGWSLDANIRTSYAIGEAYFHFRHPILELEGPADAIAGGNHEEVEPTFPPGSLSHLYHHDDHSSDHDDATGLTTSEFGFQSNFDEAWDFDDTWTIGQAPDGEQRPILRWQD